jgi:poly(A) polymerase/tRNA nucleotidyltransferase (CCA-adding enzyme)
MAHGTVTAISAGRPFEITTLRRDMRTDGRRAEVAWTDDWREDAERRDFTINAMSLDRSGTIHDYFGGASDLAAGRVRFVGDAATRVAEDYLRVLRFFRFYGRYGRGAPDAEAVGAISGAAGRLGLLSPERVWSELKRILAIQDPLPALLLMQQLGVLGAILPDAQDVAHLARLVAASAPADPLLRLGALLTGDAEALAGRLRLSNAERGRLTAMHAGPVPSDDADDGMLRRLLADEPAEGLIDRIALTGGSQALRRRLAAMQRPMFPLQGRDALALGLLPGPALGAALAATRQWWIETGCSADRAACLETLALFRAE